jgi:hypothetical protein
MNTDVQTGTMILPTAVYWGWEGPEFDFVCMCGKRNDISLGGTATCECGEVWEFNPFVSRKERA